VAQGLADDEGIVGGRHDGLIGSRVREHRPLVLRVVLLDVLLIGLLRQRNVLLVELLARLKLLLHVGPILVVIRRHLLVLVVLAQSILVQGRLLFGARLVHLAARNAPMRRVIVANHLLLRNPLRVHGHALAHQVLILVILLVLMLLSVDSLVRVPPLVEPLLAAVLLVLAVDHVIILEVLAHCRVGTDGVQVVHLDCILKSVVHLAMVFSLVHRGQLLVLVHACNRAHARLCRLLLS